MVCKEGFGADEQVGQGIGMQKLKESEELTESAESAESAESDGINGISGISGISECEETTAGQRLAWCSWPWEGDCQTA